MADPPLAARLDQRPPPRQGKLNMLSSVFIQDQHIIIFNDKKTINLNRINHICCDPHHGAGQQRAESGGIHCNYPDFFIYCSAQSGGENSSKSLYSRSQLYLNIHYTRCRAKGRMYLVQLSQSTTRAATALTFTCTLTQPETGFFSSDQ